MKRNMDLIRDILLAVEADDKGDGRWVTLNIDGVSDVVLTEHLFMMDEAGLIEGNNTSTLSRRDYQVRRLAWLGHDFLDAIRDPEIWKRTKAGAKKAGTETIEFLWELAKAYGKNAIKEKLGIDLT